MKNTNLHAEIKVIAASIADYPTIQNMARFYVYDISRECGFISEDWACPSNGLYESFDFKNYFEDPSQRAYLVKVKSELAGFVLLNQEGISPEVTWNMGQFFILAKFQGKGIARLVANQIWQMHAGLWEVSVIPENRRALSFWRKTISAFTHENYTEEIKTIDYDEDQPKRYVLSFDTKAQNEKHKYNAHYHIAFLDKLDEEIEERMTEDLIAYEKTHGIDVNYKRFSVVISNEDNVVCGVVNAFTAFAEIYIDDIWVDSDYRDKGYGRKLLLALEEHFKDKGFNNINLCTSAFQAPEFYKKCGFKAEFTRVNKVNPKLSKTFFVKFFENTKQTQGLFGVDAQR